MLLEPDVADIHRRDTLRMPAIAADMARLAEETGAPPLEEIDLEEENAC